MPPPAHEHLDVLMVCDRALWPADQGYRVHGPQMARALQQMGLRVAVAAMMPPTDDCEPWLRELLVDWPPASDEDHRIADAGWAGRGGALRHRLSEYQGFDQRLAAGLVTLVRRHQPRAVVALGQHGPMLLRGLRGMAAPPSTVWYAADEPVSFEFSCLRREPCVHWPRRLRNATIHLLLQRAFAAGGVDVAIAVSPGDARALRRIAGIRRSITIRNGVDLERFSGRDTAAPSQPRSLAFWGRLDFEPNVDAVCWFACHVWPTLHQHHPDATWRIIGKAATAKVRALADIPGIDFRGEVADVRQSVADAALAILPMRCGGGIKNKLLEAAAMGLPVLASPRAVHGLALPQPGPFTVCRGTAQWMERIEQLWSDPATAAQLGEAGQHWVQQNHTWAQAAQSFVTQVLE